MADALQLSTTPYIIYIVHEEHRSDNTPNIILDY